MKADTFNNCKILIGCFVIDVLISGAGRLSSIYFVESITRYNVDRNHASFPFVLIYMVKNFAGPLVGYVEQIVGTKWLIIFGSITSTLSIGGCFFAEDILVITLLWGLLLGLSYGLVHNMQAPLLNSHFGKGKSKANAFVLSGSCVGGVLLPPITTACIQSYGTSGSFLVLAAVIAHMIPASLLVKFATIKPRCSVEKENGSARFSNTKNNAEISNDHKNDNHMAVISNDFKNEKHNSEISNDYKNEKHNSEISNDYKNAKHNSEISNDYKNEKNNSEFSNDYKNERHSSEISSEHKNEKLNSEILSVSVLSMIQTYENLQKRIVSDIASKGLFISNPLQNSSRDYVVNHLEVSSDCDSYFPKGQKENAKDSDLVLPKERSRIEISKNDNKNKFNLNKQKFTFRYFRIFIEPAYIAILIINGINVVIITLLWTVILDFVRDKDVPENLEIYYVILLPVTDLIGRLSAGYFLDKRLVTVANSSLIVFIVQAVAIVVIVYLDNYILVMVLEMLISLCLGMTVILDVAMTHEFVDEDSRKMAQSCRIMLYGPLSFTIAPMIGYFRGGYGSYDNVFHILSVASVVCGLISYTLPHLTKRRRSSLPPNIS